MPRLCLESSGLLQYHLSVKLIQVLVNKLFVWLLCHLCDHLILYDPLSLSVSVLYIFMHIYIYNLVERL